MNYSITFMKVRDINQRKFSERTTRKVEADKRVRPAIGNSFFSEKLAVNNVNIVIKLSEKIHTLYFLKYILHNLKIRRAQKVLFILLGLALQFPH